MTRAGKTMGNRATLTGGRVVEYWDAAAVREALYAAGVVLYRLRMRGCWPAGYRSTTPEPVLSYSEQYAGARERIALKWERPSIPVDPDPVLAPVPAPAEITLLDQVQSWVCRVLSVPHRRALLALMHGASLRALGKKLKCSHVTAAKLQREAVAMLVLILNAA